MQTIVISVQTRDVDLAAREPLVITINERVRDVARAGEKNGAGCDRMRWDRHFGLGLSKTRDPMLEVNSARREAALRLRFQQSRKHASVWGVLVSAKSASKGFNRRKQIHARKRYDRDERCMASRAFKCSSLTANHQRAKGVVNATRGLEAPSWCEPVPFRNNQ